MVSNEESSWTGERVRPVCWISTEKRKKRKRKRRKKERKKCREKIHIYVYKYRSCWLFSPEDSGIRFLLWIARNFNGFHLEFFPRGCYDVYCFGCGLALLPWTGQQQQQQQPGTAETFSEESKKVDPSSSVAANNIQPTVPQRFSFLNVSDSDVTFF